MPLSVLRYWRFVSFKRDSGRWETVRLSCVGGAAYTGVALSPIGQEQLLVLAARLGRASCANRQMVVRAKTNAKQRNRREDSCMNITQATHSMSSSIQTSCTALTPMVHCEITHVWSIRTTKSPLLPPAWMSIPSRNNIDNELISPAPSLSAVAQVHTRTRYSFSGLWTPSYELLEERHLQVVSA